MEKVKSIRKYTSPYDLMCESYGEEAFCNLSKDEIDFLKSYLDYENISLFVVDGKTVYFCEDLWGDVCGDPMSVEDFVDDMLDRAEEEA